MVILPLVSGFVFGLALAPAAIEPLPSQDLLLTIEEDRGFSGDHSTLCLVRVVNLGRSTLAGHDVVFEARAIREGRVAARQGGRFGLTLGPHETLETKVAFLGRYDRFEVSLADAAHGGGGAGGKGRKRSGPKNGARAKKRRKS